MAEQRKEGELTDADLAAYGIPAKPQGTEGQIEEQAKEMANKPEVSYEAVERAGKS
jgi:hypothetical protein